MESIIQSFPVDLKNFNFFVRELQSHIQELQSEAAKTSRLGKLVISFFVTIEPLPSDKIYLVEYAGKEEIRILKPRSQELGFRQTWNLGRNDDPTRYDFLDEKKKIERLVEETKSHIIVCTIIGSTLADKFVILPPKAPS